MSAVDRNIVTWLTADAIRSHSNEVIVSFCAYPVSASGVITPAEARAIAAQLIAIADECEASAAAEASTQEEYE